MRGRAIPILVAAGLCLLSEAGNAATLGSTAGAIEALAPWDSFINEAAQRFGLPSAWIEAVMMAESAGRTHAQGRPIRSHAGAMGLMQVMPSTYDAMRSAHALGPDPDDPHDNILAGTAYLRTMYDRFGYPGLFGAYNAGPERYAASLKGRRLPLETRIYLARITRSVHPILPRPSLFVAQSDEVSEGEKARRSMLFVVLSTSKNP